LLVLLSASIGGTISAGLAALCLAARAWTPALGCAALVGVAAAAGALTVVTRPRLRRAAWGGLALSLAVGLTLTVPWPRSDGPALVRSIAVDGGDPGAPWFGGISERDLVRLGAWLDTRGPERQWLERGLFDDAYARLATSGVVDPGPSYTLEAWLHDRGHVWFAAPEAPGPVPLVVFLHGNGGPFQWYPEALARAAVARGFALAMPTWGFGNWRSEASRRRIADTVEAAARVRPIDRERVYLAGLSAGGFGAVDAFARDPSFRACAALAGAPGAAPPGDPPFAGRPLLLIHGVNDPRVPVELSRSLAASVRARGGRVDYDELADADHFFVLTHEAAVVGRLFDWLRAR
jgi:dienelactone hydrolase